MVRNEKRDALAGTGFLVAFALWTLFIQIVDIQSIGPHGSKVGFAAINAAFHNLSGVHMLYCSLGTPECILAAIPLPFLSNRSMIPLRLPKAGTATSREER